jgi:hypothetical protein
MREKMCCLESCLLRPSGYWRCVMKWLLPMISLVAACAFHSSCERHEFEGKDGTKQLHEAHEKRSPTRDKRAADSP